MVIVDEDVIFLKGFWVMVCKEGVVFIGSYVYGMSEFMMFDNSIVNEYIEYLSY